MKKARQQQLDVAAIDDVHNPRQDRVAIGELAESIREHGIRLCELEREFDALDARLDEVFRALEREFDALEARLDILEGATEAER